MACTEVKAQATEATQAGTKAPPDIGPGHARLATISAMHKRACAFCRPQTSYTPREYTRHICGAQHMFCVLQAGRVTAAAAAASAAAYASLASSWVEHKVCASHRIRPPAPPCGPALRSRSSLLHRSAPPRSSSVLSWRRPSPHPLSWRAPCAAGDGSCPRRTTRGRTDPGRQHPRAALAGCLGTRCRRRQLGWSIYAGIYAGIDTSTSKIWRRRQAVV